jgi:hypothetical protein
MENKPVFSTVLVISMKPWMQPFPGNGGYKCRIGTLWMLDEGGDYLYHFCRGPRVQALKDMKLKNGEGMAGWVVQNRQAQIVYEWLPTHAGHSDLIRLPAT